MTNEKENPKTFEELLSLFKLKKDELKQIESDIEKINTRMHEMLKTNPHFLHNYLMRGKNKDLYLQKNSKI